MDDETIEDALFEIPSPALVQNDLAAPADVIEEAEEVPHVPSKPLVLDGPPSGPAALTAWESLSGTVNTH